MSKLNELLDHREMLVTEYRQTWDKADREGRKLSLAEVQKLDALNERIVVITLRIATACAKARIRAALA